MSVLSKDFQEVRVERGTVASETILVDAASSTVVYPAAGVTVGPNGQLPLIAAYPITSELSTPQGIRLASAAEVAFLKAALYGGVPEPLCTTLFTQMQHDAQFGKPLHVWSGGDYITMWYGSLGPGLYVFVGYDYLNYPTQTIALEPTQQGY